MLTSMKTFLSHGGGVSSSLRNITPEKIKGNFSITRIIDTENDTGFICISRSLDRAWEEGWGAKFLLDQPSLLANMGKSPKKGYTKKNNYLSFAWPTLRLNVSSGVSSQWRYSNVVLFVTLEPSNSAPLLSLY